MWAVKVNPFSFRAVNSADECADGEIPVASIPDGANASNSKWDSTLNNGAGGVRFLNSDEASALAQAITSADASVISIQNTLDASLKKLTATSPYAHLSPDEVSTTLVGVLLAIKQLFKGTMPGQG